MQVVQWSDSMSVGMQDIDDQHKVLISTINELCTALQAKRAGEAERSLLARLATYAQVHFKLEEDRMLAADFKGFEQHVKEHRYFETRVAEFQANIHTGEIRLALELLMFLRTWLRDHILGTDAMYSEPLLAAGFGDPGPCARSSSVDIEPAPLSADRV